QCSAGCGMRDGRCGMRDAGCDGRIVEIGFEELRRWCGTLIQSRKPTRELTHPASRIPHPEVSAPNLPQLQVCWLREGHPEPRILPRGEGEVGERGARGAEQRGPDARCELG